MVDLVIRRRAVKLTIEGGLEDGTLEVGLSSERCPVGVAIFLDKEEIGSGGLVGEGCR